MTNYTLAEIEKAKIIVEADRKANLLAAKRQKIIDLIAKLNNTDILVSRKYSIEVLICLGWKRIKQSYDDKKSHIYRIMNTNGEYYLDISKYCTRSNSNAPNVAQDLHAAISIIPSHLRVVISQSYDNKEWKVQLYNNNKALVSAVKKLTDGNARDIARAICMALLKLRL